MRAKRRRHRLHVSSHAKVHATRSRQALEGGVADALASALGVRAVGGRLGAVGAPARLAQARALRSGVTATGPLARSASAGPTALWGARLARGPPLGPPDQGRLLAGGHGQGSSPGAMVGGHGAAVRSFVLLGARGAQALAPFGATVWVPAPGRMRRARGFAAARWAPWPPKACQRAPASAPVAKTVSRGVSGMASGPWASCGRGTPCPGSPVARRHTLRGKTR